ncbi:MAG: hypothetical protein ACXWJJ_02060, partial [Ramlibacter sp.]
MADTSPIRWLAALLAALTLQAAHGQQAQATQDAVGPAPASVRWWASFQDAPLNLLLASVDRSARPADRLRLETSVATEYVSARYNTLRLITARELADTAQRRLELLQRSGGADDEALRQARQMAEETADRVDRFQALRADSLGRMAASLEGQSPQMLALLLAPALQDTRVALPSFEAPPQVPGVVLRHRADVAAAEAGLTLAGRVSAEDQLQFARYIQALASSIAPIAPAAGTVPVAIIGTDMGAVLDRAREDVGRKLWQLSACLQTLDGRRADFAR